MTFDEFDKLNSTSFEPLPLYVVAGPESLFRRLTFARFRNASGESWLASEPATWDDLPTTNLFTPHPWIGIQIADEFIQECRSEIEKHLAGGSGFTLVLSTATWRSNTKLAKKIPNHCIVECYAPSSAKIHKWCREWCERRHGKKLAVEAVTLLVNRIGSDATFLDLELAKLSAACIGTVITPDLVRDLVAPQYDPNVWAMWTMACKGNGAGAFGLLQMMFESKQDSQHRGICEELVGSARSHFSRLIRVLRLKESGKPLPVAMDLAGIRPGSEDDCIAQIKHLGRVRINSLYDKLLEANLGMRSSESPRLLIERFIAWVVAPRTVTA